MTRGLNYWNEVELSHLRTRCQICGAVDENIQRISYLEAVPYLSDQKHGKEQIHKEIRD